MRIAQKYPKRYSDPSIFKSYDTTRCSTIYLQSGEKLVSWKLKLVSNHCPFCVSTTKFESLKALLDHLDSFHSQFNYRAKIDGDSAFISMKLAAQDHDTDPMFVVHTEGYVLSSRMRLRFPNYVDRVPKRGNVGYPFLVKSCKIPKGYGYIFGAPGTGVSGRLPESAIGNTSVQHIPAPVPVEVRDSTPRKKLSQNAVANGDVVHQRMEVVEKKANGVEKKSIGAEKKVNAKRKILENKEISFKRVDDEGHTSKRKFMDDPCGMNNIHTKHFRKIMFGSQARVKTMGMTPKLNDTASRGRLFHSVTNAPLDVKRFNEGYDSDVEGRDEWIWEMQDEQIDEVVDMLAVEKFYFKMWNQFIRETKGRGGDREIYGLYLGFINRFGSEIRRMKCEAVFVAQLTLSWKHGTLDANGVMRIMRELGNCVVGESGRPHSELKFVEKLLANDGESALVRRKRDKGVDGNGRAVFENGLNKVRSWVDEIVRVETNNMGAMDEPNGECVM